MPFAPTIQHDSRALPGVTFSVHRIGFGRRTDIDFKTLSLRQRLRELEGDHPQPSGREKELGAQLAIAYKKAKAVPADQFAAVMKADVDPLSAEMDAAIPADVKKQRAVINEEYMQVDRFIQAQWIRSGLISIEGGEADGMTADQLLDYGPDELATEVYQALIRNARLSSSEVPNSQSPTTSGEVAGGASLNTTVANAETAPTLIM